MENIPSVWSLESLAMVFDSLGELAGSKYQAKGVDVVRAILEIGLTLSLEDINFAYETDKHHEKSSYVCGSRNLPKKFINQFLDYTTGRHSNFRFFYEKAFGMKPIPTVVKTYGDAAKLLISWFSSYLLLNTIGMPIYIYKPIVSYLRCLFEML